MIDLAAFEKVIPQSSNDFSSHKSSIEDTKMCASKTASFIEEFNALEQSGALSEINLLRKENRELDKLVNDAAKLMSLTSVSDMLDYVISRFLDSFIPSFLGFLIQPPRGQHIRQYCYKNLKQVNEKIPTDFYKTLKNYFFDSPSPIICSELPEKNFLCHHKNNGLFFKPELIFPLRSIGGLYGVVVLSEKVVGGPYTSLEQLYIDRMMRFLAVGIQNGLHHESSITDPKTGLYNYDYFMQRLEDEAYRIKRHGGLAALIMIDVDYFKKFNDSYGHMAGDAALETLADVLRSIVREGDTIARFGGEEFVILLVESDEDYVLEVSDRIRDAIESTPVMWEDQALSITASLGVRLISKNTLSDSRSLIVDVDKALYRSKEKGRNCVTFYTSSLLRRATEYLENNV
ncbi:MAG TPA: GGDEF domain-containing protein [Treponemataceae bacterium]|nr:GGDEF domain-containing protein [Treponemataceae bacterium]